MSLKHRLSSGIALMFGGIWIEQGFAAISLVIIARALGVEAFGVATMAMVVIVAGELLVRETISEFLIQRPKLEHDHINAAFWIVVGLALMVAAALFVTAPLIAHLYGAAQVKPLLRWGTLSILSVSFAAVPVALLRRDLAFKTLAARAALGSAVGGTAGVVAALMGAGAWSLIIQRLVQAITIDGLVWILYPFVPRLRAPAQYYRDVFGFGARIVGIRSVEVVGAYAPSTIIALFLGPAALSFYTVAWRLVDTLVFLLTAPIRYVAQPAFAAARRGEGDPGELLREISEALSLVSFACLLGLAAIAEPLVIIAFGPNWAPAAAPLRVLVFVGMYYSIERMHISFCVAMGRMGQLLAFSAAETVLGIALMSLAAPYGVTAVSAALLAALLIVWPLRLRIVKRLTGAPLGPYLLSYAPPFAAAACMAAAAFGATSLARQAAGVTAALGAGLIAGVAVYAALGLMTLRERLGRALALARAARRQA